MTASVRKGKECRGQTGMQVCLTTDKRAIYGFLQQDPYYAAYAIGDLEPALFAYTTWYAAKVGGRWQGLVLLYRGLQPPVILTMGTAAGISAVFAAVELPQQMYMSGQVAHLPVFRRYYDFSLQQPGDGDDVRPMLRMAIKPEEFVPIQGPQGQRLGPGDVERVRALFAHGGCFAPDAFSPVQLQDGVFFGLEAQAVLERPWQQHGMAPSALVAVAGTHLVAPSWGVAAIGNIYTHPALRGRGLSQLVSSAVTAELLRRCLLVVLNVHQDNQVARHVYHKLGYRVHCPFYEGIGRLLPVHQSVQ